MPRLLASMTRFSIWSLIPRPCRPPIRLASRKSSTTDGKRRPFSSTGCPCSKVTVTSSGATCTSGFQWATPMIGLDDAHPGVELLQILGLVGGAQRVGVGGVGLLGPHLVGQLPPLQVLAHLLAAAEGGHEGLVEPGLVDAQVGVDQDAVAVEPLDVVPLVRGAVAEDVDAVLAHGPHDGGGGDRPAERGGVVVLLPAVLRWKALHWMAAIPSRTRASRQSMSRALTAPCSSATGGMSAGFFSSGWARSAV